MKDLEKISKKKKQEKINKTEKIKIIKNDFVKEELLSDFYKYIKENDIAETENVENADLIVSFGGDGTILVAAKETLKKNIPVMAVNMGTVGYMAEIKPENAVEMLEKYRKNECIIDERAFLEIEYNY